MRQSARLPRKGSRGSIQTMMIRNFLSLFAAATLIAAGCDAPVGSFPSNDVYSLTVAHSRNTSTSEAEKAVSDVIGELFGTPNQPNWPAEWIDADLHVSEENLARAAGPQLSEKDGTHRGLFREHCVTCHALSGSGTGPASVFQNPYPRDFRPGVYKWKSTLRSAKPTRDDLTKLLHQGVAGSGMPSFALIDPDDLDALVDYVIYLSVRGETERELMAIAIDDLGYGEDTIDEDARLQIDGTGDGTAAIAEVLSKVSFEWASADSQIVELPDVAPPDTAIESGNASDLAESVKRGQELFHGQIANCAGCHGKGGAGDLVTLDYDDWDKEYSTRLGLTPSDREAMRPFRKAGAPTPRLTKPRNLTSGVYRGGKDTATLYRRITQGIAGTPMPGIAVVSTADGTGLTSDQAMDLVHYVESLSPTDSSKQSVANRDQ